MSKSGLPIYPGRLICFVVIEIIIDRFDAMLSIIDQLIVTTSHNQSQLMVRDAVPV